jgi:hypothetical protein
VSPMDRATFQTNFTTFLLTLKPDRELPPPAADTHLWEQGYLDSFSMLQVVDYLEQLTGEDIALGPDGLSTFFTVARIYDIYIAGRQ